MAGHSDGPAGWDNDSYRVVEDLRGADRIDAIGPEGLVRSLLFYREHGALTLRDGAALDPGRALFGWWRINSNMYPLRCASAVRELTRRAQWGRALIARQASFDPAQLGALLCQLVEHIEPGSADAGAGLQARLAELDPAEQLWAGLLREAWAELERANPEQALAA